MENASLTDGELLLLGVIVGAIGTAITVMVMSI